ncbi:MAG: YtxH domain-containing protein [Helicobacteraceae bacterium]|jgi:hypothetical protein|nr:YtxH domain-containing protein [Helicobacteraceae bacterium]
MANETENHGANAANSFLNDVANAIFGGSSKEQFIKGAVIGGLAAYLLTNKAAQEAIFKTAIKFGASSAQFFGELKDRFDDAKAEVEAELGKEER